jgi:hypothetical protein
MFKSKKNKRIVIKLNQKADALSFFCLFYNFFINIIEFSFNLYLSI